ncbi:MAG: asparaginase [Bacilli bacterium]
MKNILLIATGGTIASKESKNGLKPQLDGNELINYLDDISDICHISTISLLNLDSTNINYHHWIMIIKCIEENYEKYDGFVISHGTDTMAYTSSALSYMIQNSRKPIVLTGSQKSIFMRDSDARNNLTHAIIYACDNKAHGVNIVFDGKIILGTRAKKTRSKSFNAFSSVNYPQIGFVRDRKVHYYFNEEFPKEKVKFYYDINPSIFVLKLFPGIDIKIFDYILENYDALIIESFGVGGIPMYYEEDFSSKIEKLILANKTIIITTQVEKEGSDMSVYQVGRKIKEKYQLIEARDMTTESIVTKVMWIRGLTSDPEEVKALFLKPIHSDIIL